MKLYSKQGLWTLFLVCAFPLHVWTIILAFRDFSWVAERTNAWDALGVASYGLVLAFIESVIVFVVAVGLGLLVSRKWTEERRIALVGVLVIVASLWAIGGYLFFMFNVSVPVGTILFFKSLQHPLRVLYAISLAFVGVTVAVPAYFVLQSQIFLQAIKGLFERVSLLTTLYLFFDAIGLIIVVVRNI